MYILLIIVIGIIFIFIPKEKFKKIGLPITLICFILFFGLRNNLGIDDSSYIENFNIANSMGTTYIEKSYINISRLIYNLGMNYKAVFLFYSVLTFIFMYLIIKRLEFEKKYLFIYSMSFICFCFFPYLTVMRQFLSTMIIAYSALLLKEKRYIKALIMYMLAGYIHSSAFFMIAIMPIFLDKVKISKKIKIVLPILAIVLSNTGIIKFIFIQLAEMFSISYINYVTNTSSNNLTNSGLLVYLMFLIYLAQFLLKSKEDSIEQYLEKGEMLFFTTFFVTSTMGFVRRLSYYFMFFECFVFITFIKKVSNLKYKNTIIIIFTILQFSFLVYGMAKGIESYDMSFSNFSFNILR